MVQTSLTHVSKWDHEAAVAACDGGGSLPAQPLLHDTQVLGLQLLRSAPWLQRRLVIFSHIFADENDDRTYPRS